MSKIMKNAHRAIASAFVMLFVFCFIPTAFAADSSVNIVINGKAVTFTDSSGYPYIDENGRTMVPLSVTMEAAGAAIGWDSVSKTAIVITEHNRIEVPIGADYLYCNNVKIQNDTTAVIKDGRTYLPIAAVLKAAHFTVEWDGATRTVSAYTLKLDDTYVPYSAGDLVTLAKEILAGNVVYMNGQYYATPEYVKMLVNTQIVYIGDDLNTAIYPQASRYELADTQFQTKTKEWVSELDLEKEAVTFDAFPVKGFYGGLMGSCLHAMPDLPDNFKENPTNGVYSGVTIKVENGEIWFHQDALLEFGVLDEPITEAVAVQP